MGGTLLLGRGGEKGFGMMVSSFFAAIMSARGRDLYSYASNDLLVVLWVERKEKGERKKCKKSHPDGETIVTSDLRSRHLMRSHE